MNWLQLSHFFYYLTCFSLILQIIFFSQIIQLKLLRLVTSEFVMSSSLKFSFFYFFFQCINGFFSIKHQTFVSTNVYQIMTFSLLTIPDFRVKFEDKSINKTIIMSNNTRIKSKKVDSTKTFIQKKFTNRDAFLLYSLILGNIFYTYFNVAFILSVAFTNVFI